MTNKFAVGAIIVAESSPSISKEEIRVELIEADTPEFALGSFFKAYLGKPGIMIRDFSIRGDGVYGFDVVMVDFLKEGKKIHAIRRLRELTGQGLKEAKEYIEEVVIPDLRKLGVIPLEEEEF